MPRYEFSKGTSHKFWEISLKKNSFTTTYGKVGSKGQSSSKEFPSAAEAKKAYEKLVVAKVKKGYALPSGSAVAKKSVAKKSVAKKSVAKKSVAKKSVAKKSVAKKSVAKKSVAKKATKKVAPTKATGNKSASGVRCFEFSDAKSSKFWEVSVKGSTLTTRYGRIGAKGQSKTKEFGSAAEAKKARDKLITEKTKKGYGEKGAVAATSATDPVFTSVPNPELEAGIIADPDDLDSYAVLADWLQEQGDPRGELMALQLRNKDKQAKALIKKHSEYFFGPLAEHQTVYDGGINNSFSGLRSSAQEKTWKKTHTNAFLWRLGYIHRVRLSHDRYCSDFKGKIIDILAMVLGHPSGRFINEFAFQSNDDPNDHDLQELIDLLGKKAPATTRKITLGDNIDQISWHQTGNLKKLWKGVPNLRVLEIETGQFEVGNMKAPALERAIFITGGLSKTCGRSIAKAEMPNIKHLEIYYGDEDYGGQCSIKEVLPLLGRTDLKQLEYLGLENSTFSDDIAASLRGAKVLKTLKTLDLSLGTMTDEGAQALVAAKASLRHLECLDLRDNFLSAAGIKAVKGLCKQVLTEGQEKPDDWDGEKHYFVSVSE